MEITMNQPDQPMVLQLAPLPRQQIGPFLILGVDKDAPKDVIEAAWAQRLIWARKNQVRVALEDINWAREIINDPERRVRADAVSFNLDTTDGLLTKLRARYQGKGRAAAGCQPLDIEKNLSEYSPPTPVPDIAEVRAQVPLPEVPRDVPAVKVILEQAVQAPVDPWDVEL
jgi:hypothetical protein